jgi:hypothetical protein
MHQRPLPKHLLGRAVHHGLHQRPLRFGVHGGRRMQHELHRWLLLDRVRGRILQRRLYRRPLQYVVSGRSNLRRLVHRRIMPDCLRLRFDLHGQLHGWQLLDSMRCRGYVLLFQLLCEQPLHLYRSGVLVGARSGRIGDDRRAIH